MKEKKEKLNNSQVKVMQLLWETGATTAIFLANNTNANVNSNTNYVGAGGSGNPKSKTTAIVLCCCGFFGIAGLHKFYEGKTVSGILYLCTIGWCCIGTIIDLIALLGKPSTYYV